ncbi:MAG: DnaB-like helicase C-terminal domain-containing protein [bacterium]
MFLEQNNEKDFTKKLNEKLDYLELQKKLQQEEIEKKENATQNIEISLIAGFLSDHFLLKQILAKGFEILFIKSKFGKIICSLLIDLYEKEDKKIYLDATFLKKELISRNLFSSEVEQFYEKIIAITPPNLSESMAYVEILKTRVGRENLIQLKVFIEDYLNHIGPSKDKDIIEFIGEISRSLIIAQKQQLKEVILPVKYKFHEVEKEIRKREFSENTSNIIGFSLSPFLGLNNALSGLRKGFYYGLAGAPRRGKTNFSLILATYLAKNNKIPVLYYSWEQTQKILTYRILGKECMISPSFLQTQNLYKIPNTIDRVEKAWDECKTFTDYLFLIEGSQKESFERIEAHAYNAMQEFGTNDIAIFVDYLQKIPIEGSHVNQQMRINLVSTKLAELSLKLNCPIFAISSLDKEGCKLDEKDSKESPSMHHCAGSGDIEYDLDVALVLSKDWYDTLELHKQLRNIANAKNIPERKMPKLDVININIEKNRDAPPGISPILQYLFLIEENNFIELGYKNVEELHTYNKIAQIIKKLINEKLIWRDEQIDISVKISDSTMNDIMHNM